MCRALALLVAFLLLVVTGSRGAIILPGQVANFQDGTTQGWVTGPIAPAPSNIATGGPAGAGDRYLQITSDGNHLAVFNPNQWAGDYQTAGVMDIGVDFRNPNPNTLANIADMRIVLFGPSGSRWSSTNFLTVAPDSLWHHYTFSLRQSDLTQVVVGDTYAGTITAVDRLMFRHDNGVTPNQGGTFYNGSLGIDNVTALPEPAGLLSMIGMVGVGALRRHRRHRHR